MHVHRMPDNYPNVKKLPGAAPDFFIFRMPFSGQASLLVSYLAFNDRISGLDFFLFTLCPALRRVRQGRRIHPMPLQISFIFFSCGVELRDLFHEFRFLRDSHRGRDGPPRSARPWQRVSSGNYPALYTFCRRSHSQATPRN